jgi:hypothetical protein
MVTILQGGVLSRADIGVKNMGKIICGNPQLVEDLQRLRNQSSMLNVMVDEILFNGDLTIHLFNQPYSYYDNRNIVLGLNQLPTRMDVLSTLIMEICNAFCDARGQKPLPANYPTATAYGEAVERQEWSAVKWHIKIFEQLLKHDPAFASGNRFKQAFTDPRYNWGNFDNYLAHQRHTGHTAQVESHWKK